MNNSAMAWIKPGNGFLKLNVKGVFNCERRRGAVGCILRDHRGAWVKGCGGMIGCAVPMAAELWAIFYGLKMAWEHDGPKKVIIESDSADAMQATMYPDPTQPMADHVLLINNLMSEKWSVLEIVLVDESANQAAKGLADFEVDGAGGVNDLAQPPAAIRTIVDNDS